jgi:hypothetical protein
VFWAVTVHANPYYDPTKPHHAPDGFRNLTGVQVDKPLSWLLRWRIDALRDGLPPPPQQATRLRCRAPLAACQHGAGAAGRCAGDGAAAAFGHLDRPCDRAGAVGRPQHPDRSGLQRPRLAGELPRPAARTAAGVALEDCRRSTSW